MVNRSGFCANGIKADVDLFAVHKRFTKGGGLTAMWNRNTLLRAEHGLTAPFLRLAIARRLKLNTSFVMDNCRILMGLVYPVRFGGF